MIDFGSKTQREVIAEMKNDGNASWQQSLERFRIPVDRSQLDLGADPGSNTETEMMPLTDDDNPRTEQTRAQRYLARHRRAEEKAERARIRAEIPALLEPSTPEGIAGDDEPLGLALRNPTVGENSPTRSSNNSIDPSS